MTYSASEARQQLLDSLAEATDELGFALACLTEAYERLDDHNAERLEETFFRPVQAAYGRARRTHTEFADRHGLPGRGFEPPSAGLATGGAPGYIQRAVEAVGEADLTLASLQDSMLPVEAGDEALRAGLTAVRDLLTGLAGRARELGRTLGR
jgi:hypothetical protein